MNRFFAILLVATTLIAFQNCGTDTGNPYSSSPTLSDQIDIASARIESSLCAKISACHTGVTTSACGSTIDTLAGLGEKFGGASGSTLKSLRTLEANSHVSVSRSDETACLTAIDHLSCTDPAVVAGYDSQSNTPYAQLGAMVPTANCPQTFSAPQSPH